MGVSKFPTIRIRGPRYGAQVLGLFLSLLGTATKRDPECMEKAMYFLEGSAPSLPYINPKLLERTPKAPEKDSTISRNSHYG